MKRSKIILPMSRPVSTKVPVVLLFQFSDVCFRGLLDLIELRVIAPAAREYPAAQPARLLR